MIGYFFNHKVYDLNFIRFIVYKLQKNQQLNRLKTDYSYNLSIDFESGPFNYQISVNGTTIKS